MSDALETYEELMQPMFLRLGGCESQLYLDPLEATKPDVIKPRRSVGEIFAGPAHVVATTHRTSMQALEHRILANVYAQTPEFFELMIIDLLLAMGYANRRRDLVQHIGRSHDGGVDGIISQDFLGLDVILIQAKRLKPENSVSSSQIRDFIGTLETKKANKGIFVTTGDFSCFAKSAISCVSHRVRLINGSELSKLMVRHNLGAKPMQSYVFKELDHDYFTALPQSKPTNVALEA